MPAKSLGLAAFLLLCGVAPAQQSAPLPWSPGAAPARSTPAPYWTPGTSAAAPVQQARFQPVPAPGVGPAPYDEKQAEQTIQLEPPGPDRVFRLESEDALKERWRQELQTTRPGDRQPYPDEPILTRDAYYGRNWQARTLTVEPNYLAYGRLNFEQLNFERYGWDLGPVSTALSPLTFFLDVATLPYHAATDPFRCFDSNAGYCLPGDPVPLMLYPPQLSATGALAETAVVLTLLAVFP
jgi:hypothetical protein